MVSGIWYRNIKTAREETHCCYYIGYSFRLAARVLLYTSREALAGTKSSSMGPPRGIDPTIHRTMSVRSTTELQYPNDGSMFLN